MCQRSGNLDEIYLSRIGCDWLNSNKSLFSGICPVAHLGVLLSHGRNSWRKQLTLIRVRHVNLSAVALEYADDAIIVSKREVLASFAADRIITSICVLPHDGSGLLGIFRHRLTQIISK